MGDFLKIPLTEGFFFVKFYLKGAFVGIVYCFYPRDAMLARVIVIATCPSDCQSVTLRYCVKTKKVSGMISSPPGSPKTLVF